MRIRPSVSICLLTWNRAEVIARSLDSLLAQTYQNFELIINDDCSTDATESVCREYERRDPRVRYYRNTTNLRYSGNSNAAVSRARGDYIMFAHDGDIYHPSLVSKWVDALEQHPTAALAFCALNVMDASLKVVRTFADRFGLLVNGDELLQVMLQRFDSPIFGITMVRKSFLDAAGPFDDRFPRLTDIDMWMRLLAHYDAVYLSEPLIDIMLREKGHDNTGVNWQIIRQLEEIRLANIVRYFRNDLKQKEAYLRQFAQDRRNLYIRNILSCIRHGNMRLAWEGCRRLVMSRPVIDKWTHQAQGNTSA